MKMLGSHLHLAVLLFAILPVVSVAQSVDRPKPGFSVSIEDDKTLPDSYPFGYHRLLVTYTNTSGVAEDARILDFDRLNMIVLYDGAPAEETKLMRQERKYREALASGKAVGRAEVPRKLKPGESVTMPLYISDYFDTSKPGTYTITVNQETYPWDPARSVTVWSNTITIIVPEPGAQTPQ
jgi:hypothetical protein